MDTSFPAWHAHVYFDADTVTQAQALCETARDRFGVAMGRMHHRPVGPHPAWSCQLSFPAATFAGLIPWLAAERGGLTVFVHPLSGDEIADHTRFAIWMGSMPALDLTALEG